MPAGLAQIAKDARRLSSLGGQLVDQRLSENLFERPVPESVIVIRAIH
jgi:hypothetical protein